MAAPRGPSPGVPGPVGPAAALTPCRCPQEELHAKYGSLLQQNEEASRTRCQELLAELAQPLDINLAQGTYAQPRGYRAYQADRQRLVDAYREAPRKGIKVRTALRGSGRGAQGCSLTPLGPCRPRRCWTSSWRGARRRPRRC